MAFGYAAAGGRPGAYCVVPGPGFLNTTAALATAYACNAPVVCLSGQVPLRRIGRGFGLLHELPDQLGIMQRLTKWATRIDAPHDAPRLIAEAFEQMLTGRPRPVALEIPMDVLAEEAWLAAEDAARPQRRWPRARSRRARARRRPAERRGAANDLRRRRRPGRQRAGARPRRAARRAGGRRLDGPGRDGRPLPLVAQPDHGAPPVARGRRRARDRLTLPARADRLGAGRRGQGDPHRPRPGRDHPPRAPRGGAALGRRPGPRRALAAGPRRRPTGLVPAHRRGERRGAGSVSARACAAGRVPGCDPRGAARGRDSGRGPDPGRLRRAPRVSGHGPRQYISSGYQGTLGHAYASALGAKVARPERAVVALIGDGGFMYNVQELATAVLHGINVVAWSSTTAPTATSGACSASSTATG